MKRLLTALGLAGLALLADRRAGSAPGHVFTSGQDTPTTGFLSGDGAALASPAYPGLYGDADQDHRRAGIAPGHVIMSARAEPAPGFLACNGDQHPVAAYPALHDAIGDAYNDGDEDPGYFRVPNYTDRFPSGHDRGSSGGLAEGDTQDVVIPWSPVAAHVHDISAHTHPLAAHTHTVTGGADAHRHDISQGHDGGGLGADLVFLQPLLHSTGNDGLHPVGGAWVFDQTYNPPFNTDSAGSGGGGPVTSSVPSVPDSGDNDDTIQTGLPEAEDEGDDTTVTLEHAPPAYVGNNFEIKT